MQTDVKALQQQALATQASLKKLQTREAADPVAAIVSELPTVPGVDAASLGLASVLVVALGLVWWYVWRRPQNRPVDAGHSQMSDLAEDSAYGQPPPPKPTEQTQKVAPVQESPATPTAWPVSASPFAKPEPPMGFDSEAAATEVMRVRKSLAEKREARLLLRDQAEPSVEDVPVDEPDYAPPAAAEPWSMPAEDSHFEAAPALDIDIHFTLPDDPPEPEPEPVADGQPVSTELDINIDEVGVGPVGPDYATTLALAQVSAELELLNEARDLAYEVLQSDDPALQSEARALLDRLSEVESEMGPESIRWDDLR